MFSIDHNVCFTGYRISLKQNLTCLQLSGMLNSVGLMVISRLTSLSTKLFSTFAATGVKNKTS